MAKHVFISYCHQQGEWVWGRLVPCLHAGGSEIYIDRERFKAGKAVLGQMDSTQDKADVHVLVLSTDYFASKYCVHEMNRAINQDPKFQFGKIVPILRTSCTLPAQLKKPNPLYVNLQDDKDSSQWDLLLQACRVNLGVAAPDWLAARDDIVRYLRRNDSVNLVISGQPKWREIIRHIKEDFLPDLGVVDLESGATVSRRGLVAEILKAFGGPKAVPKEPEDLVELDRILSAQTISRLVIEHFDLVANRPHYGVDLFATLRNLISSSHKLVLLAQSRKPFSILLPRDHPLSPLDLKTVELKGRT